jgi:ABC-type enterochelin transport system ATPase subunit
MSNLFTDASITKDIMREARRLKSNTERAVAKIQKEIDYAAKHSRGEVIIHTGDFNLTATEQKTITSNLLEAGYKHRWRCCGCEDERIHIWWEEEDE